MDNWGVPVRRITVAAILSCSTILASVGNTHAGPNIALTPIGIGGHVEMPSAFMLADGETSFSYSADSARDVLALGFQALPGLDLSLAFPTYHAGSPTGSDPSLNIRATLWDSADGRTALALGLSGLFANDRNGGEYLVMSHRAGDFELSAGIGWGIYGAGGPIGAPFGPRPATTPEHFMGFDHLFRGNAAPFVGVTWDTPIPKLSLSAEYAIDSINNTDDPRAMVPNVALRYDLGKGLQLEAYSRGLETTGFMLTFNGNPQRPYVPPHAGIGPQPILIRSADAVRDPHWADDSAQRAAKLEGLQAGLEQEDIRLLEAHFTGTEASVTVYAPGEANRARTTGRVARMLARIMPASVETFRIIHANDGYVTSAVVISRSGMEAAVDQPEGAMMAWDTTQIQGGTSSANGADFMAVDPRGFSWNIRPSIDFDLSSTNGIETSFRVSANGTYTLSRSSWISGSIGYTLAGRPTPIPPPLTPQIRKDIGAYDFTLPSLDSLTYTTRFKLAPDVYARASVGLFERQYGGVSAEVLWRPADSRLAFGLEVTEAVKRAYQAPFGFLDLNATTAIASVYWDTGLAGTNVQFDFGQYLAGDMGAQLKLSRRFTNGWDVSLATAWSENMGDKELGWTIGVQIPVGWTYPTNNTRRLGTSLGGAGLGENASRVRGTGEIYDLLRPTNMQTLNDGWGDFWN